jgi:hypothetical protein
MRAKPLIVYVSGPMTTGGNFPVNIRNGIEAAAVIMEHGYVVICPHEKALGMEMLHPMSYDDWMEYDYKCVEVCDAIYRMPAASRGGDLEVAYAAKLGIPVFYSFDTLFAGLTAMESERAPIPRIDVGQGFKPALDVAGYHLCSVPGCSNFGQPVRTGSGCPGTVQPAFAGVPS